MDATGLGILALLFCLVGLFIAWWRWQQIRVEKARQWPKTEATIESGELEVLASNRFESVRLPVFAFSYKVDGEYHSGRFALTPYSVSYDESIIVQMIGRKLTVCYNPADPEKWLIPDDAIEGYKVEQRMGPHLLGYYPRN